MTNNAKGALKSRAPFLLGGSAQKGRLSFVQLSENEGVLTGWGCYGILELYKKTIERSGLYEGSKYLLGQICRFSHVIGADSVCPCLLDVRLP